MVSKIGKFFRRSRSWPNDLKNENNRGWAKNFQGIQIVLFERHKLIRKGLLYKKQVKYIIGLSKLLLFFCSKIKI